MLKTRFRYNYAEIKAKKRERKRLERQEKAETKRCFFELDVQLAEATEKENWDLVEQLSKEIAELPEYVNRESEGVITKQECRLKPSRQVSRRDGGGTKPTRDTTPYNARKVRIRNKGLEGAYREGDMEKVGHLLDEGNLNILYS